VAFESNEDLVLMLDKKKNLYATVLVLAVVSLAAHGQGFGSSAQSRPLVKADAVTYLFPEQVSVPVGKPSQVALHFRIAQGLHINSHTPSDEFLIPTTFSIPDRSDDAAHRSHDQAERVHRRVHPPDAPCGHGGQPPGAGQTALPGLRPEPVHAAQDDHGGD
jgi:hypothetical protein